MTKTKRSIPTLILAAGLLSAPAARAEEDPGRGGEVRVPLTQYQDLLAQASAAGKPRPAPARYAFSRMSVRVAASDQDGRVTATVTIQGTVRTFESAWSLVPLLPGGVAVTQATVSGEAIALVASPEGLAWASESAGSHSLMLVYQVDATRRETGYVLPIGLPPGATGDLSASLPGSRLDAAVIPSVALNISDSGGTTTVSASLPATSGVQISWRTPSKEGHALSRARYQGELRGEAVVWTASLGVESFTGEIVMLPLLPTSVTLSELSVDGKQATVHVENGQFAAMLKGRGVHDIVLGFQVPVLRNQGPPQVVLDVPEVPVSRFELTLPGKKDVTVVPAASVTANQSGGKTVATVFAPLSSRVTFTWTEAIPEDVEALVRANASIYHIAHAEEGVLHVRAMIVYEITRGETNVLELAVPDGVQVNRITAPSGGISDWRVTEISPGKPKTVSVFLDRSVKGEFPFDVFYERLLGAGPKATEPVEVPLLAAARVHRQRGMIALLSGPDLALNPEKEDRVSKVGENQLPAFVRDAVTMTVAHTYKYIDADPVLTVRAVAPERKRGKFDAQVDTLVSIGEVTLKGSATIEINVKSGTLMELELDLPANLNVLGLTGPSLRNHEVKPNGDAQRIDVAFTQEMEGQFRLEVSYERILADNVSEVVVPTVAVSGAEVEHGRIAVEALTAVEVQAATVLQLSSVDVNELPQQLVLKTTNPILLAYKYVHVDPPFQLGLKVTRHKEIDVQAAAIESAHYRTLFTSDGLAVTKVDYTVRNSRKQFLKVALPEGSEVWSVFVAGRAEKPALAGDGESRAEKASSVDVLIKMINSADGFPVELVYATKLDAVGSIGTISSRLPRPDMVVTNTRWDVFLPAGLRYKQPETNMELITAGAEVQREAMEQSVGGADKQMVQPLRIAVPTVGVHYAFEKLYANQSAEDARFSIAYVAGDRPAQILSLLGILLIAAGVAGRRLRPDLPASLALGGTAVGAVLLAFSTLYLGHRPTTALLLVLLIVVGVGLWRWRLRKAAATPGS